MKWLQVVTVIGVGATIFFGWDAYKARRRAQTAPDDRFRLQIRSPEEQHLPSDDYLDGVTWEDLLPPPVTLENYPLAWDLQPLPVV